MRKLVTLLHEGLNKVASVIESNPNYDYILGDRIKKEEYDRLHTDTSGNLSHGEELKELWSSKIRNAKPGVYPSTDEVRKAQVLAFATTANNRREISFLKRRLAAHGLPSSMLNLCDLETSRIAVDHVELRDGLEEAFALFLDERQGIKRGLFHQLISYASFALAAYEVLSRANARTFVVANDHSPAPVAYTKVAQYFRMKTVYLQHAEVTSNFPPLDFDLSVLRNRESKRTYQDVGPARGEVLVVSRDPKRVTLEDLEVSRDQLKAAQNLAALIYPSGVSDIDSLESLYRALESNPDVSTVAVKVHPAAKNLDAFYRRGMSVRRSIPQEGHVAVCGNSSVAIELIAAGHLVFQCFELDKISRDYYGFVSQGLTQEVRMEEAAEPFWRASRSEDLALLGEYLPNLSTRQNVLESLSEKRQLTNFFGEYSLNSAEILQHQRRENLLRDVYCLTRSVVSYASTVVNLYGDDFWVIRTLDAAFAQRDVELNAAYSRVGPNKARSVLEFWLASKAIEWNGHAPTLEGRDNLARFVRQYEANPRAKRWLENKMFDLLVRYGNPIELIELFSTAEHLSGQTLGSNKKVAFARYTERHPEWRDRLRRIFNPEVDALTPLEELKLSVQGLKRIDGQLEFDNYRQVEGEFVARHPIVAEEYTENVISVYDSLGGRAAYIDVLRNSVQRSELIEIFKRKLRSGEGYSFIRLSDGEGIIFKDSSQFFSDEDSRNRQRHWWGEEIPENLLRELVSELQVAVRQADLLGIPSVYRFLRDHSDRTKSLSQSLQGRGLLSVLQGLAHYDEPGKRYTDDKANVALFSEPQALEELMDCARKLVIVSSGAPEAVSGIFGRYGGMVHIPIPTHNKTQHNSKYVSSGRPLPYVYHEVNDRLKQVVRSGDLVLVGGGVAGKTFVRTAKYMGGVGLDIGSAMDQLLDAGIHSLF